MTKFARWSGIAHAVLTQSHRKFRLGQAQEILAASFGHRTYASLRTHDLQMLNEGVRYVLFDDDAALNRASSLQVQMSPDEWRAVRDALRPSGVSGNTWLIDEVSMQTAACLTFDDSSHNQIDAIVRSIGSSDGHRAHSAQCQAVEGSLPDVLSFSVEGDVRAFGESVSLAVPVFAAVAFVRVGRRFYAEGKLLSVEQSGPPREYEPDFIAEDYGMSDS